MAERQQRKNSTGAISVAGYDAILADVAGLLDSARRTSARAVNAVMTATYWQIGRRIVEFEQQGAERARYRTKLIQRLSADLSRRFGRGFGVVNLTQMRRFYQLWPASRILQTSSEELAGETIQEASHSFTIVAQARAFPLPWSSTFSFSTAG